jgi:hypothetical protein
LVCNRQLPFAVAGRRAIARGAETQLAAAQERGSLCVWDVVYSMTNV